MYPDYFPGLFQARPGPYRFVGPVSVYHSHFVNMPYSSIPEHVGERTSVYVIAMSNCCFCCCGFEQKTAGATKDGRVFGAEKRCGRLESSPAVLLQCGRRNHNTSPGGYFRHFVHPVPDHYGRFSRHLHFSFSLEPEEVGRS